MNDLQRYLVEEAVEDYEEGRLTRREALKAIARAGQGPRELGAAGRARRSRDRSRNSRISRRRRAA